MSDHKPTSILASTMMMLRLQSNGCVQRLALRSNLLCLEKVELLSMQS
jgi:hypothetical protein